MIRLRTASAQELADALCVTDVDRVPGDPDTSAFKAAARLHQARWRQSRGLPIGTHPIQGAKTRPFGCRLPLELAKQTGGNFLDPRCTDAVRKRLATPQRRQMLKEDRLYADLLSSMPMCFNLFGTITEPEAATRALRTWWPDIPGKVEEVIFEWSPGRGDPAYLGNGTSFDVAFLLDLGGGKRGVLGVETKYHEHPTAVGIKASSVPRYKEIANASGLFAGVDLDALMRDKVSQIWLDHLLVLAMLQHESANWSWGRFVTVYPDANPSWERITSRYASMLSDRSTFATITFDDLMMSTALEEDMRTALIERYRCWER